jgi:hypothetical protein
MREPSLVAGYRRKKFPKRQYVSNKIRIHDRHRKLKLSPHIHDWLVSSNAVSALKEVALAVEGNGTIELCPSSEN